MTKRITLNPNRRQFIQLTAGASTVLLAPGSVFGTADSRSAQRFGRGQTFNLGWRFHRGSGEGFEAPDLNDESWRRVDLPHDWSIETLPTSNSSDAGELIGPFDKKAVGGTATGFTVGGEGWYRKTFRCAIPTNARAEVLFEGVYMNSDVWINGHLLGSHYNGYTPFGYDLTPFLSPTGQNVLAVRVKNEGRNTRWYSGSGIYRNVWLDVLPESVRIARWGVGISTRRIDAGAAEVEITTKLEGIEDGLTIHQQIKDSRGTAVWAAALAVVGSESMQSAVMPAAKLWSPQSPHLYTLHTEVRRATTVVDRLDTRFGCRIVSFDAATGMAVNGAPTKLRGGCIHHDNGLLGAAAFPAAERRKVRLLKARGYNAVRTAHNPYSTAFLDACDELGVMVIAESFDSWTAGKAPQDYSVVFKDQWSSDIESIVRSQRHHPSIVAWSIGNEISERNLPAGIEVQWQLANRVHSLDPTRPVTAAINDFPGRPVVPSDRSARAGTAGIADYSSSVFLDLVGYNYKHKNYEQDHQRFPSRVVLGTESFPRDIFDIWAKVNASPYVIGDFVWTAIDYLGEVGLGGATLSDSSLPAPTGFALGGTWPGVISQCGDLDITGCRKGASLARDVVWGLSDLEVAVRKPAPEGKRETVHPWGWPEEYPSWTWPGAEGKPLDVTVYTSADRVELRLNDVLVDSKPLTPSDKQRVELKVPYQQGTLEVVAYRRSSEIARRRLTTTRAPAAISLIQESARCGSGRGDLSYLPIEIVDADGHLIGFAATDLRVSVAGPAELVAFGSANPNANRGYQSLTTTTYNGRALLILRGTGKAGTVEVSVAADNLRAARKSMTFI